MEKYDVISFREVINPGQEIFFDYDAPDYSTIEKIDVYFAQGQQFALQVNPVIIQSGSLIPTPIITFAAGTDQFLSGDNIVIERRVTRPLTPGDKIRMYVKNTDAVNTQHLSVDISIDYYAGKARVI